MRRLSQPGNCVIGPAACGSNGDAQAQHRGVAEPEGQARDEADLGDLDRVKPYANRCGSAPPRR